MREFREVRKRLSNTPEASSPYIGYARKLLGELKRDMAYGGLLQGVRRRQIDGVLIEAASVFGQDEIRITPFVVGGSQTSKTIREKKIVKPRWIFCTPAVYSNLYLGPASDGAVYIHDHPSSEPRKLAQVITVTTPGTFSTFAGAFDWKQRNLAVGWYFGTVGCAYINPLSGAILFSKTFAGAAYLQDICSHDGVVYLLHGNTPTIRIVTKDTDEAINISGTLAWATWMFLSKDGKYLVLCAGQEDIAPPYRVHVFDIESRTFIGSPYLREFRVDFNSLNFAWDDESDALYLFHDYVGAPNSITTMTRINLVDGALEEQYEVTLRSGAAFSVAADTKAVCAATYEEYKNEPGIEQFMDPKTGAIEATYVDPEEVGSNWPTYLVSDRDGATYSHSSPYSDNDFRMARIQAGKLKWASQGSFIPFAYGESFQTEVDLGERPAP